MTDKEIKNVKIATLYELRWLIDDNEKENFSKEELLNMIDTIAKAKDQEM